MCGHCFISLQCMSFLGSEVKIGVWMMVNYLFPSELCCSKPLFFSHIRSKLVLYLLSEIICRHSIFLSARLEQSHTIQALLDKSEAEGQVIC